MLVRANLKSALTISLVSSLILLLCLGLVCHAEPQGLKPITERMEKSLTDFEFKETYNIAVKGGRVPLNLPIVVPGIGYGENIEIGGPAKATILIVAFPVRCAEVKDKGKVNVECSLLKDQLFDVLKSALWSIPSMVGQDSKLKELGSDSPLKRILGSRIIILLPYEKFNNELVIMGLVDVKGLVEGAIEGAINLAEEKVISEAGKVVSIILFSKGALGVKEPYCICMQGSREEIASCSCQGLREELQDKDKVRIRYNSEIISKLFDNVRKKLNKLKEARPKITCEIDNDGFITCRDPDNIIYCSGRIRAEYDGKSSACKTGKVKVDGQTKSITQLYEVTYYDKAVLDGISCGISVYEGAKPLGIDYADLTRSINEVLEGAVNSSSKCLHRNIVNVISKRIVERFSDRASERAVFYRQLGDKNTIITVMVELDKGDERSLDLRFCKVDNENGKCVEKEETERASLHDVNIALRVRVDKSIRIGKECKLEVVNEKCKPCNIIAKVNHLKDLETVEPGCEGVPSEVSLAEAMRMSGCSSPIISSASEIISNEIINDVDNIVSSVSSVIPDLSGEVDDHIRSKYRESVEHTVSALERLANKLYNYKTEESEDERKVKEAISDTLKSVAKGAAGCIGRIAQEVAKRAAEEAAKSVPIVGWFYAVADAIYKGLQSAIKDMKYENIKVTDLLKSDAQRPVAVVLDTKEEKIFVDASSICKDNDNCVKNMLGIDTIPEAALGILLGVSPVLKDVEIPRFDDRAKFAMLTLGRPGVYNLSASIRLVNVFGSLDDIVRDATSKGVDYVKEKIMSKLKYKEDELGILSKVEYCMCTPEKRVENPKELNAIPVMTPYVVAAPYAVVDKVEAKHGAYVVKYVFTYDLGSILNRFVSEEADKLARELSPLYVSSGSSFGEKVAKAVVGDIRNTIREGVKCCINNMLCGGSGCKCNKGLFCQLTDCSINGFVITAVKCFATNLIFGEVKELPDYVADYIFSVEIGGKTVEETAKDAISSAISRIDRLVLGSASPMQSSGEDPLRTLMRLYDRHARNIVSLELSRLKIPIDLSTINPYRGYKLVVHVRDGISVRSALGHYNKTIISSAYAGRASTAGARIYMEIDGYRMLMPHSSEPYEPLVIPSVVRGGDVVDLYGGTSHPVNNLKFVPVVVASAS